MRFKWGKSFPFTQAILQLFPKHVETKGALGEPKKNITLCYFCGQDLSGQDQSVEYADAGDDGVDQHFLYKTDGHIGS